MSLAEIQATKQPIFSDWLGLRPVLTARHGRMWACQLRRAVGWCVATSGHCPSDRFGHLDVLQQTQPACNHKSLPDKDFFFEAIFNHCGQVWLRGCERDSMPYKTPWILYQEGLRPPKQERWAFMQVGMKLRLEFQSIEALNSTKWSSLNSICHSPKWFCFPVVRCNLKPKQKISSGRVGFLHNKTVSSAFLLSPCRLKKIARLCAHPDANMSSQHQHN